MAEIVNISESQGEIAAGPDAPGTVSFDVVNVTARKLDVALRVVPDPAGEGAVPDWITISGDDTITLDANETRKIEVEIAPPADASPAEIAFCLKAFEPALPEENTDLSNVVTATIAAGAVAASGGPKWGLIAALVIGVLVLIGGGVGAYFLLRGPGGLPNMEGMTIAQAQSQLDGQLLASVSTVPVPISEDFPDPGLVAGQTPDPEVAFGEEVDVVLEVTALQMPNVTGAAPQVAIEALQDLGIETGDITIETPPVRDATGLVTDQRPVMGDFLVEETEVALVIPTEAPVIMPKVTDLPLAQARRSLADAGIPSSLVRIEEPERNGANGTVTAQVPEQGIEIGRNTTIVLTVPTQALLTMPPVTDQTVSRARQILQQAGFNLNAVRVDQPERVGASGRVSAQNPPFNTRVPPNTRIVLTAPRAPRVSVCATAPFAGTWSNADRNTRSVTKIIIKPNCNGAASRPDSYSIQMFASCSPSDCDWGEEKAAIAGPEVRMLIDQGFVKRTIRMRIMEGQLVGRFESAYNDSRPNRSETLRFNRQLVINPNLILRELPQIVRP
ncbi:MAG: PASTA domain-containing protein [Pseudomonadota bacterium]